MPPDPEQGGLLVREETPSGLHICFQAAPKRMYLIWDGDGWLEVPSVTTVLDVLHKPGLTWWGQRIGVDGVITLIEEYDMAWQDGIGFTLSALPGRGLTTDEILALLTQHKLTVNHVRDSAGDRGTSVHDGFELWAHTGMVPHAASYPEVERPYFEALERFIEDVQEGSWQTSRTECMVGSLEHRFAGRYDWRGYLSADLVTKVGSPGGRRAAERQTFEECHVLLDVKTSKGIYDTHFLQLEGYEGASLEDGYDPTDLRMVLHLTDKGEYEVQVSSFEYDDFLAVRAAYEVFA